MHLGIVYYKTNMNFSHTVQVKELALFTVADKTIKLHLKTKSNKTLLRSISVCEFVIQ